MHDYRHGLLYSLLSRFSTRLFLPFSFVRGFPVPGFGIWGGGKKRKRKQKNRKKRKKKVSTAIAMRVRVVDLPYPSPPGDPKPLLRLP